MLLFFNFATVGDNPLFLLFVSLSVSFFFIAALLLLFNFVFFSALVFMFLALARRTGGVEPGEAGREEGGVETGDELSEEGVEDFREVVTGEADFTGVTVRLFSNFLTFRTCIFDGRSLNRN